MRAVFWASAARTLHDVNRLAGATSPYLLQHADNPVDWHAWGDEAFEVARREDRPVLVSVGYSSCHWCHVMAHESFEDSATAALMNELFVNVKVDREERPDVDAVTMEARSRMTGSGGWPTTVFMTPDGKPFYAGTYFPPEPRHGLPSFREVLVAVAEAWRERRADVDRQAERLVDASLRAGAGRPSTEPLTVLDSRQASRHRAHLRAAFGGFGGAPKFPPASALELLLRRGDDERSRWSRDARRRWRPEACTTSSAAASTATRSTTVGSCRTSRRCSTTTRCSHRHISTPGSSPGSARYREVVEETVDYMLRELRSTAGGLASAQDADTDGVEGLTYTWTPRSAAAGIPAELLEPFEHGRWIVRGELDPGLRASVLELRARRQQPFRDDKAIASWNGLALAAIAEAAYRLERDDWFAPRASSASSCSGRCRPTDGRLLRSLAGRRGRAATASSTTTRTSPTA